MDELPPELNFIAEFLAPLETRFHNAPWLLNEFNNNIWSIKFISLCDTQIDWGVKLANGSKLTAPKNAELLESLKVFCIASTMNAANLNSNTNGLSTQYRRFAYALNIIDLLLLEDKKFGLSRYGLAGLSEGDLKNILNTITESNKVSESVYKWPHNLKQFSLELLQSTCPIEIAKTLQTIPQLSVITPNQMDDDILGLPLEIIPRVRAALHIGDYYRDGATGTRTLNSEKVSLLLYKNTLNGRQTTKPIYPILSFDFREPTVLREFQAVDVTTKDSPARSKSGVDLAKSVLGRLCVLHELGLPAPEISAFRSMQKISSAGNPAGSYRSVPSKIVFKAIKDATELHLKYGKEIIDGFCRIVIASRRNKIKITELTNFQIQRSAGKKLCSIGLNKLGLAARSKESSTYKSPTKPFHDKYFTQLRSNFGLLELLCIYIGAVQIVIGSLVARRVGELIELEDCTCLDLTRTWLMFRNRKSTRGLFGLRRVNARPIEPIAVEMIDNLIRLHKTLNGVGFGSEITHLFASPNLNGHEGFQNPNRNNYIRNLDLFCDYFETEINSKNQRYYIRQHQLRRFFAMTFFSCSSFGGLDTLQWMLGHADIQHVWHYITETVSGSVLRGAKSQYIAECLHRDGVEQYKELSELIHKRYGTMDFHLTDSEELEGYIEELMKEGTITIEPEFIMHPKGQAMTIVVTIRR